MASQVGQGLGNMAGNGTATAGSFLAFLVEDVQKSTSSYATVVILLVFAIFVHKFSSPELDSREPPAMKSRIPVIGHLIGMIQHQSRYFKVLERRNMGIATLPILNGKMYGIWDPILIQAVYRNRNLSFEPFAVEFAQRELGFNNETLKIIENGTLLPEFFEGIHVGMAADNLHRMNASALAYVSDALDDLCRGNEAYEASNFWIWVRDLMTMATTEALYGPGNPLKKDASLMKDTWIFESDLPVLMLGIAPSITARRCFKARARLQAALGEYYGRDGDSHKDASQIVRNRANVLRKHGIPGREVGIFEVALLHVATSNTIPTLFWFMVHVFSRPELVARLRDELLPVAQHGGNGEVTLDIGTLDDRCPLLVRCYREAIRVSSKGMGNRRVLEDTTISDGSGKSYLLKKGCNVQMSSQVSHSLEKAWGKDQESFDPDRFIVKTGKEHAETEKLKRAAFIPFGGGRHLCPGRNFAFAENLGFVASLLLGFDVVPLDGNMESTAKVPKAAGCSMTGAAVKPVDDGEGYGVRVRRREGWEGVKWRYIS
ncbi:uncharacterized protein CCOS01_08976 [Colletotrichum costaricense]|uniref:Prostacyclin synthase n=1 Tax=Colletotrichum costaricense TaxID=1209916 RepID=A0AAJ0DYL3_9PEZI|nr:uncharacterized protein CCOS01_08976 [Colletotrichum costaricense]KAK1523889.1 hypothetical protein CCOS01_08976 [Colletotrichum costaricense]